MTLSTDHSDPSGQSVSLDFTGETSPYPFFEHMRHTDPVWHGALADHTQMPEELRPGDEWVLFGYDGVFQAFRDDRIFTSAKYDKTIGLVMGHTILAMGGKEHHDHRNLVAKAFRATALERWEPAIIGPVCDQLVDEIKNDGQADLVKAVTFEFPTRIISVLLGLPAEDLALFRRLSLDLISIPTDIMAGLNAAAELHDYFLGQVEQRRRKLTDDIIGDLVAAEIDGEKLTDEAIIAFLRLLLPVGQSAVPAADPPGAAGDGLPGPVTDTVGDRRGPAVRDPTDDGHADHHRRSRNRRQDDSGRRADRHVHGLGQPRRKPLDRPEHL